jgi:predicted DNA-binding transcriptional regulator AlpA
MKVPEAAEYLGVSAQVMYNITNRNDFDALIRVGKKKIILTERFISWIDRMAAAGANVR